MGVTRGICPFFSFLFDFLRFSWLFSFFIAFFCTLSEDKGKGLQLTAKMGNFHSDPVCTDPCKTSRLWRSICKYGLSKNSENLSKPLKTSENLSKPLGWPRSTVEKGPQSNQSYERENPSNRTFSGHFNRTLGAPKASPKYCQPSVSKQQKLWEQSGL